MSNPHDYTVGWVCAISTEYVAAQAFLDERHDGPASVGANDNNDYTLGRIGKHNIVIAVLPFGEYGIVSAASVAKDMLRSFPNVRIGLMVGIGGGAPSRKHDIRLGDVVVSVADKGKGGVFQYDYGKAIQGQTFQETGFLNQPPSILRTAVNGLMAQYEVDGHVLEESINAVLDKKPRLRKKYSRPEPATDRLYQPGVVHPPGGESSCAMTCGNDPTTLVARAERTEDEDNPSIHHGLIASANTLMKDALIRDTLARDKGVLCFEMEAAGLVNQFPCLVIRGICDYSDSHKNKDWQGYAAMTAAAYAKDLLRRIAPTQVEAERRINEIICGLREEVAATSRKADTIIRHQQTREAKDILDWLTPVNYGLQHSDYLGRQQPGTGQWLLETPEFCTWQSTHGQTLFCRGIPGAGKTILTSIVVDHLETAFRDDRSVGIGYIYCNFRLRKEQTAKQLLSSLLKQLAQSLPRCPEAVVSLHDKHKHKYSRPSLDEISRTLQSTVKLYSRVFIIIDALDECHTHDDSRARLLEEVLKLHVNVFATSRSTPDVTKWFKDSISLEIRATDEDVRRYVQSHLSRLPASVRRSPDLQEEVIQGIVSSVGGMFLLAQLHLESLVGKTSVKAVRTTIAKLPTGSNAYDLAYETAMERIENQVPDHQHLAKQILSWVTCAKRSLTTVELRHALAVEVDTSKLDKEALPEDEDIEMTCVGLVTIDKQSDIIRLVHYTTQQYFDKNRGKWFPDAEDSITTTCVTYLSFDVFGNGFCPTDRDFEDRMRLNPFYDYSAHYWGAHAREARDNRTLLRVIAFLDSDAKAELSSQALMAKRRYSTDPGYSQKPPKNITGLHLAAYFGVKGTANEIIRRQESVDLRDSHGRTPLSYATQNGHADVVNLLLDNGADMELKDTNSRSALWWAVVGRQETIVSLLADRGADLESEGEHDWTPLQKAAMDGARGVCAKLLEKGACLDSHGRASRTALAMSQDEGVTTLLLEKGADLESEGRGVFEGQTPLSIAAESGREAMVRLLLENGANPRSTAKGHFEGRTPLSFAAGYGHEAVVSLLLHNGSYIDARDKDGMTPLSFAAQGGHRSTVKLLLQMGADREAALKSQLGSPQWGLRSTSDSRFFIGIL